MSRSIPVSNSSNPAKRWFEWDGEKGSIRYYDKALKKNVFIGDKFNFLLLEEMSVIKGWHDPSQSGITSNEVRSIRDEKLLVKSFEGGMIAEGFYADIKEKVNNAGGHYTANLYVAFKDKDGILTLGSLQLKGGGLNAWVEFSKKNRNQLYSGSISIEGSDEGKKGRVIFKTPKLFIRETDPETDEAAKAIDRELQKYLERYLTGSHKPEHQQQPEQRKEQSTGLELEEDDIPF